MHDTNVVDSSSVILYTPKSPRLSRLLPNYIKLHSEMLTYNHQFDVNSILLQPSYVKMGGEYRDRL